MTGVQTCALPIYFNAAGYALQGQLLTLSFMQAYNKVNFRDTLDITDLNNTVHTSMKGLVRDFSAQTMGDSVRWDSLNDVRSFQTPTTNSGLQKGSNRDTISSSLNQNTPGSNRRPNPVSPPHQTHRSDINPTPPRSPSLGNEQIHVVKAGENQIGRAHV